MEEINIDEFSKIDLRVAKIIEVFEVELVYFDPI